jgi:phage terminase small subunit
MDLTAKQKLFCVKYIEFNNATKAAKEAGYSEKTAAEIGCENLRKPNISKYIRDKQKKLEELAEISPLRQLKILVDIAYHNKKERTTDRLKAIEIINKMLGYNEAEKLNIKKEIDFSDLSTEELIKRADATKKLKDN